MADTADTADMAKEALDWMLLSLERSQEEMITHTADTVDTEAQDLMLQFSVLSLAGTADTEAVTATEIPAWTHLCSAPLLAEMIIPMADTVDTVDTEALDSTPR